MRSVIELMTAAGRPARRSLDNPPGRPALSWRAGTYPSFLAAMAARMRGATLPDGDHAGTRPLARLDLAERHNWVMALAGAWAAVGDVLTFYQERILNEGFLRTAVEDLSVRELVLTVGYVPHPAVAGSAPLAFTVADLPGVPPRAAIRPPTRVLSVPRDEELPQVFEVLGALDAHAALNELRPLVPSRERRQVLRAETVEVWVAGAPAGLIPGAALVVIDPDADGGPTTGRTLRVIAAARPEPGPEPGRVVSRVRWQEPLGVPGRLVDPRLALLRQRSTLFGHGAPPWQALPEQAKREVQPILGGVSVSADRGATVRPANEGLPARPVRALAVATDGAVYAAVAGLGVYRSLDRGASWQQAAPGQPAPEVLCLAAGPSGHLYAGTATGVHRTTDRGTSWQPVGLGSFGRLPLWRRAVDRLLDRHRFARLPETAVRALLVDTAGGRPMVYAGTDLGVFRTALPSTGWQAVNRGLPGTAVETGLAGMVVRSLAPAGGRDALYAGGDGGVFRSRRRSGELRWRAVNLGLPGRRPWSGVTPTTVAALAAVAGAGGGGALVAGTARGVFRSTDGGGLWRPSNRGLPAVDPATGESATAVTELVAATDPDSLVATLWAATDAGLQRSDDLGESWLPVTTGAPDRRVTAVAATPEGLLLAAQPFDGFPLDEWPGFFVHDRRIDLSTAVAGVVAGGWVALTDPGGEDGAPRAAVYRIERVSTVRRTDFGLTATVTRLEVDSAEGLTGFDLRRTVVHLLSEPVTLAVGEETVPSLLDPARLAVAGRLPADVPRLRRVVVQGRAVRHASFAPGRAPAALPPGTDPETRFEVLGCAVGEGGELTVDLRAPGPPGAAAAAVLAAQPAAALIPEPPAADRPEVAVDTWAERIEPERLPPVVAERGLGPDEVTVLALHPVPRPLFDAGSVKLYANVALATQGETVEGEVLGSGDATRVHQGFALRKPPLTYFRDPETGVVRSTLAVRVDDLLWEERPSLWGAGPGDRVFMVRPDRQGRPLVVFGDGVHGARLPTGSENVTASYRSGVWTDPVGAGHLNLLQTRPIGLRSVTNPLPAEPGVAPEPMARARRSAPRSVRTLGRVISLRDYGDFARTYPGVARAAVRSLWNGAAHLVHLTVAPEGGRVVAPDDDLLRGLARAIETAGSPSRQVAVACYRPLPFRVAATVIPDRRYRTEPVLERAAAALAAAFAFDRRGLAEPLAASQVIAALQAVEGVAAVDLDLLHPSAEPRRLAATLEARPARLGDDGALHPAELLVIDAPQGIRVTA